MEDLDQEIVVAAPTPQNIRRRMALLRVLLLVVVVAGMYGIAAYFDLLQYITKDNVRMWMTEMGWKGYALYVGTFIIGNLLQIPSNVFLGAAVLSFGFLPGWAIGYSTNLLSILISFIFVRTVGGRALDAVERPWVRKALDKLDTHPVRTVAVLRLAFAGAPWLNYLLSMSNVRLRDYMAGSVIGLGPHFFVLAALMAWFIDG